MSKNNTNNTKNSNITKNNLNLNLNSNVKLKTNINNDNSTEKSITNTVANNKKNTSNNTDIIKNTKNTTNTTSPNIIDSSGAVDKKSENNIEDNKLFGSIKSFYSTSKQRIAIVQSLIDNTPIIIKIMNIIVPFIIAYIFTKMYYNIYLSVFFAIITVLAIFFMTKSIFFSFLYLIFYIWLISTSSSRLTYIIGTPISQTDLRKIKEPFNFLNEYKVISKKELLQTDASGSFTYSFWINITTTNSKENFDWFNYWKLIFYRGTEVKDSIVDIDTQYPGFWLTPKLNNLVIVFKHNRNPSERIELINIPLNTWVNISTVIEGKSVSIYINGLLDRTLNLEQSNPNLSNNNIYIGEKNSNVKKYAQFPGYLAQLTYYNYSLTSENVYDAYIYNKNLLDQYDLKRKSNYETQPLITNSDYLEFKNE